jgi:hypothetical protein
MNPTVIAKIYAPKTIVKVSGISGLKGNKGLDGRNFALVSTQRTEIVGNRILLPSKPEGDLLFNMMMVFDTNGDCGEYDDVSVFLSSDGASYAVLNEQEIIAGFGVVSYLTKVIA